jgi:hypothetical protein
MDFSTLVEPLDGWIKMIGGWVGLIGGIAGLYAVAITRWERRIRVAIDHTQNHDAHKSWHRFTITNRSDLPMTFRYIGPAWFMTTPLLRQRLNFAMEVDGYDPDLTVLAPKASVSWDIDSEFWELALPLERRKVAYLRVGIELPFNGKVKWIKPRRQPKWDLSVRERWIHKLYPLYGSHPLL